MNNAEARLIRRRNGRLVACNPCRLRKVACDHTRPVCARCQRRKQSGRCVYPEPEPLSEPPPAARHQEPPSASIRIGLLSDLEERSPVSPAQVHPTPIASHAGSSGFVGLTPYSTVFETQNSLSLLGVSIADDIETARQEPQKIVFADLPRPIQESCLSVLRCLPGQANEQVRFDDYGVTEYNWNHVAVDLIVQSIQQTFQQLLNRGEEGLKAMATVLCNNTARKLSTLQEDAAEWLGQFCGANLRWESLGLLWANLAQISDAMGPCNLTWARGSPSLDVARDCIGYCVEVSRFLTEGNVLLLDINRRKGTLDSIVSGDATLPSMSAHGVSVTMMTFLGLHVLENGPSYTPSFCSEYRRRIFAQVFCSDKLGMVFTGRPPLIGHRFCCTPMPLDIPDEHLMADPATLARVVQSLDRNGWGTAGVISPTTILRARFMVACIRDEIHEIALGRNIAVTLDQLSDIKSRQQGLLSEFPACLNYQAEDLTSPEVTTKDLYFKLLLRLEHLQNLFFVNKLLLKHDFTDEGDLLVVSYELVVVTLKYWLHKDRFADEHMRRNFEWLTMTYAAPGSGILCQELLHPTFSGVHQKDSQLSRSNIVQQLSLLVGFLDWVPRSASNWELCVSCKKVIQRVLDHHLNGTFGNRGMMIREPAHWDFLDQPEFSFELLDTFDWLRPDVLQ
ncbi:C6 transcription factor [Paramyrothecium foliicola]|nr:C6 transcription factor [Paramyrothecium foliicola]